MCCSFSTAAHLSCPGNRASGSRWFLNHCSKHGSAVLLATQSSPWASSCCWRAGEFLCPTGREWRMRGVVRGQERGKRKEGRKQKWCAEEVVPSSSGAPSHCPPEPGSGGWDGHVLWPDSRWALGSQFPRWKQGEKWLNSGSLCRKLRVILFCFTLFMSTKISTSECITFIIKCKHEN